MVERTKYPLSATSRKSSSTKSTSDKTKEDLQALQDIRNKPTQVIKTKENKLRGKSPWSKGPNEVCKIIYKHLNSSKKLINVDQKKLNTFFKITV